MSYTAQDEFDITIGRLDRTLSKLVIWVKENLDLPNKQTLKHHAEDMIAAGQKILKDLGEKGQVPVKSSSDVAERWGDLK